MFSSWLVFKKHSFKRRVFLPYFLITVVIAIIIVFWVSNLLKENVEYSLINTLHYNQTVIDKEIENIEMRLRFYGQFMADVDKLSDEFAETKIGRSIMVYAINFLRSNNMYPYIPKSSSPKPAYVELIKKGLMGLNSTSLIVQEDENGLNLSVDCVNPIETEAGIEEAVIISYPLNQSFLDLLNARTGADISLIYNNKVILSTIREPSTYNSSLNKVEKLPPNILAGGNLTHLMEWGEGELSQKVLLFPLKVNYKNVGLFAVSLPLKEMFTIQKNIYSTAGIFTLIVLAGIGALYAFISRKITVSPAELVELARQTHNDKVQAGAGKEVGILQNSFDKMSSNLERMTEDMRRSSDEIIELNKTLEKRVEEQSTKLQEVQQQLNQAEKLSALGELVSGVAHEINNPLSTIIGFAQIMEMDSSDDQVKTDLSKIVHEAKRASKTVKNLLTYARKEEPSKRPVQINDLIAQAIELREYEWRVNNIEVELNLAPNINSTMADSNQIKQVLLNVLNNAEQATQDTGRRRIIKVTSEESDGQIIIKVSDNGVGIPKENLSKIFDPFFTTKDVGRGTGLGLSVSYGIIREHGGGIHAETDIGKGSTFIITLPVVEGGHVLPRESYEPEAIDSSKLMDKHVLVVDDEAEALNYMTRFLESVGSKIETASNGREALMKLRRDDSFDLILCDIKMPVMDGKELYSKISNEMPEIKKRFVFATGDLICQETMQFIEDTKAKFVSKPFDLFTIKKVLCDVITHN